MDRPKCLAGVNSIGGYDVMLYFVDLEKEQRLLAQFDRALVNINSLARPRVRHELINGQVDLVLFRKIIKMENLRGNPNYQFVIEFTAEMIRSIPINEFPEESVITRHWFKLNNCVLEPLSTEMIFSYATASLRKWNGTAQDIIEVV